MTSRKVNLKLQVQPANLKNSSISKSNGWPCLDQSENDKKNNSEKIVKTYTFLIIGNGFQYQRMRCKRGY